MTQKKCSYGSFSSFSYLKSHTSEKEVKQKISLDFFFFALLFFFFVSSFFLLLFGEKVSSEKIYIYEE
tara:strand:+ start:29 stop:232 length:204 start_codon:yes stop_codon:yes gene_type:complete